MKRYTDKNKTPENKMNFKNQAKIVSKLITKAKRQYFRQTIFENRSQPKKLWSFFKVPVFKKSSVCLTKFFFRHWTSFNHRKFWPSQRPLSISLDPGRRWSNFLPSFDRYPVWCYPPICTWVFLVIVWLGDSIWISSWLERGPLSLVRSTEELLE